MCRVTYKSFTRCGKKKPCLSCHGLTNSIGFLAHFSEPCPQKAIRAPLMTSQRCWPADGWGGLAVSSEGCWTRLFVLVCGQRECPDERASFPPRLHGWCSSSGTPDWTLQTSTAQIFFFVAWRRQLVIKHFCRIASLWKCWSENRQLSRTEKNKGLFSLLSS